MKIKNQYYNVINSQPVKEYTQGYIEHTTIIVKKEQLQKEQAMQEYANTFLHTTTKGERV